MALLLGLVECGSLASLPVSILVVMSGWDRDLEEPPERAEANSLFGKPQTELLTEKTMSSRLVGSPPEVESRRGVALAIGVTMKKPGLCLN